MITPRPKVHVTIEHGKQRLFAVDENGRDIARQAYSACLIYHLHAPQLVLLRHWDMDGTDEGFIVSANPDETVKDIVVCDVLSVAVI